MKTKQRKQTKHDTLVVMLLDRTGSMSDVKKETITGFNAYLDELSKTKEKNDMEFFVRQFDSQSQDDLCKGVGLKDVPRLNDENYMPRAWTPLYDAIGRAIRDAQQLAKKKNVIFVTLTDGHENASREFDKGKVNALIKEMEEKHKWTFTYIGLGFDAWDAYNSIAAGTISMSNILNATKGKVGQTMAYAACATSARAANKASIIMPNLYAGKKDLTDDDEK